MCNDEIGISIVYPVREEFASDRHSDSKENRINFPWTMVTGMYGDHHESDSYGVFSCRPRPTHVP